MAIVHLADGGTVNMLVRDLRGKRVRTRRQLRNGFSVIAAGTEGTVYTAGSNGLRIDFAECPHCHVQIHITRVDRNDIELL